MLFYADIVANNEEGALERILRVCRHRGFWAHTVQATTDRVQNLLLIAIEGESERPLLLLTRQLEKLYGIIEVRMDETRRDASFAPTAGDVSVRNAQANQVRRAIYANSSRG